MYNNKLVYNTVGCVQQQTITITTWELVNARSEFDELQTFVSIFYNSDKFIIGP